MPAFVDIAILLAVLGVARSGWRRGAVFFLIDLVGFAAAVIVAVRFHRLPAGVFEALGADERWALVLGGLTIFIPLIVLVAKVGSRLSRAMYKPGLLSLDKILGATIAAAFALTAVVVGLLFLRSVLPSGASEFLTRSSIASGVVEASAPAITFADERFGLDLCAGRFGEAISEVCTPEGS
jgi:uncharacterized membrane protein required for colicin V production